MHTTPQAAPSQYPMLNVQNLTAEYRDRVALLDVSLTVQGGELVGILGPNGAGKSTLFKGILGLIPLKQGQVLYGNRPIKSQRHRIAYVPQRAAIDWTYPISVEQVVLTGRTVQRGWWRFLQVNDKTAAKEAMERLGVWQWRRRPVGELSGGQQQRVFLARAIAQDAQVFLLDEPLTGVDRESEVLLWDVVSELRLAG
ncbi:MAG: metal ABC transporter ATP-binding protein [Cyanophyceae cyanobacterium]